MCSFFKNRFPTIIKSSLVVLLLFCLTSSYSQTGKIVVLDSKTRESIPFAHVCFEEIGTNQKFYLLTDKGGYVMNPSSTKATVAISFIGYETLIDTLLPNKSYELTLKPHVFDLDQVVVTANYTPVKADKSIYNIKVIDQRQIQLKAATTLTDILKDQVNIQITHDPSLGSGIRLKGLSGNNVKILVDGVPVIGRMGGNIDLDQLNLFNIDHIEVVEGPMSVVYGSNALAGAINIITKENSRSNFAGSLSTYFESLGSVNLNGSLSVKKGKNTLSFSGGRNFFNGVYLDIDTNRSQQWKPKEQYNADFNYTLNNPNSKFKYQSSFMRERLLDKGNQQAPSYRNAQDSWFYSTRFSNRVEFNMKLKNDYFINLMGSHSYFERKKLTYIKDFIESTSTLIDASSSVHDTSYFNAFTSRVIFGNQNAKKRLSFIAGLDLNLEIATGKRILNEQQNMGDYAVFSSMMYSLTDKLSIQPGLRYAYNTRFEVPPVPSINMKWEALSFLNIRGSFTRGFRSPTLKELYILFKDINHDIRPNENLKPEYGNNFDLSFTINTDKSDKIHFSNIDINLFYNQMSNIIYLAPVKDENDITIYKYINISNYNTTGGQISFKYSFYPDFDFAIAFGETGTFASFSQKNASLNHYRFSPEANLNLSYQLPVIKAKFAVTYKYTGKVKLFSLDENNLITSGDINQYHNLDLSLQKKLFANRLTVNLGIKNVFNNTLITSTGNYTGTAHSSSSGSPVGYGRFFFTSLFYNIF